MIRLLRPILLALALVAAASPWPSAQSAPPQKPADAKTPAAADAVQKPPDAKPAGELPADAKAFNAAAGEKDPLKRIAALEKFIADNPKASPMLVIQAKAQISSSALTAYKESRAKYLAAAEADIAEAKKRSEGMPLYFTYNALASRLASAGIYSEEAEDFARKGLAGMDERGYMDRRKQQYERALAFYEKSAASSGPKPEAAADAAASKAPAPPDYRFAMKDGVMQVSLAPPRTRPAAPPRAPSKPTMPTEEEMRASLRAERASAQATLGQILMKRGKADEGEKLLAEAFAAKPAASTMATIARTLAESAKKAGNESAQLEYLTVLALSGRITADETKDFEAAYRKTHNGSLDGLEAMLDERYRRDHTRFAVTPYVRKAGTKATGRAVLAEVFPGAG